MGRQQKDGIIPFSLIRPGVNLTEDRFDFREAKAW